MAVNSIEKEKEDGLHYELKVGNKCCYNFVYLLELELKVPQKEFELEILDLYPLLELAPSDFISPLINV